MTKLPLIVGLAIALSGCITIHDPLACGDDGDCSHQAEFTFCDIDGADSSSEYSNECIAPPSANACNRVETCDDVARPHCTGDSVGTCVECTEKAHCPGEESCDTRIGECTNDAIFTCTPGVDGNAACVAKNIELNYCSEGDICVGCLVSDHCTEDIAKAICDEVLFECRGCEENSECDSGLCGTNTEGACVAENEVVHVGGMNASDVGACGTATAPCATIQKGIDVTTTTKNIVLVAAGTYDERVNIASGTMSIIADGEVLLSPASSGGNDRVLDVEGITDVTIDGLIIDNGNGASGTNAVECVTDTATLRIHNSTIRASRNLGLSVTDCTLTVERSTISGNAGGGISINSSNFTIVNNFVVRNGTIGVSAVGGASVSATTANSETLSFNTFAENVSGAAHGISCIASNLVADNNIFMLSDSVAPTAVISGCGTSYSLVDAESTGNSGATANNLSANAIFDDVMNNDFHLVTGSSGSPGIDAADPAATLAIDIDGDMRPLVVGGARDMGADEAE